jgi:hypothetical protein
MSAERLTDLRWWCGHRAFRPFVWDLERHVRGSPAFVLFTSASEGRGVHPPGGNRSPLTARCNRINESHSRAMSGGGATSTASVRGDNASSAAQVKIVIVIVDHVLAAHDFSVQKISAARNSDYLLPERVCRCRDDDARASSTVQTKRCVVACLAVPLDRCGTCLSTRKHTSVESE